MEQSLADYDHMVELCDRADRLKLDNMDGVLRSLQSVDEMTASCRDARSVEFFGGQVADKGLLLQDAAKRRRQAQEWSTGPRGRTRRHEIRPGRPGGRERAPPLCENGYLVFDPDSGQAVLIDPGVADPRIRDFAAARKFEIKAVLNTHGHGDHIGGNRHFADLFKAPIFAPKDDSGYYETKPDRFPRGGETLEFGGLRIEVLQTPGHTAGNVCFLVGKCLFSGDKLFKNDIGKVGTDDERKIPKLRKDMIQRIRERLLVLPGTVRVFPGHGRTTRIADEKENNPFLK